MLRQAGADDADMLVAVTNSDETNMVASPVAYTLFHTPTKIARVREAAYLVRSGLFNNEAIPVDVLISPEQVVTNYIKRLIEHPGSLQVIDFAGGKAQLVAVRAYYGGPLVGVSCASCVVTCPTSTPAWRPSSAATTRSCRRATRSSRPMTRCSSSLPAATSVP